MRYDKKMHFGKFLIFSMKILFSKKSKISKKKRKKQVIEKSDFFKFSDFRFFSKIKMLSGEKMRWLLSVAVVIFTVQFGIGCAPTGSVSGGMAEVSRPAGQSLPDAASHTEIKTISNSSSGVAEDSIDALKKAILILPFRDKSKYNGPWDIYGQLANGLADSLKRFDA